MTGSDSANNFFKKCSTAGNGDFEKALAVFLEGIGMEFLRVIQDEIIRLKAIDTRLLLASFHKGGSDSVWELNEGGLILEVGTNVEYAKYVNNGHWTCKKGEAMRFVPGYMVGKKFVYDSSAKSGIMLKQRWIDRKPFWENGISAIEKMIPDLMERKVQQWFDSYFG
ncbi:MAG: HK97 gp10 family phage protein [Oscillospiraceae bacterium]|nr:HK97 gp10 family phage protein [Oscillospiraceae bacterium]